MEKNQIDELSWTEQENYFSSIDFSTSDGKAKINDVIEKCCWCTITRLLKIRNDLSEDDLLKIYQKRLEERRRGYSVYDEIDADAFVNHPSCTDAVIEYVFNSPESCTLRNKVLVRVAKITENEAIYRKLISTNKISIINACKKNPNFTFKIEDELSNECKIILTLIEKCDIPVEVGIELLSDYKMPLPLVRVMLRKRPEWREFILKNSKLDFGSVPNQIAIVNDPDVDEETLLELSMVVTSIEVKQLILANPKCDLEMARNMFGK